MTQGLPLRYPGGKRKFVNYVSQFVKANGLTGKTIIEPFAGSGAISFALLQAKLVSHAILLEADPIVATFHLAVLEYGERLAKVVRASTVDMEVWTEAREILRLDRVPDDEDSVIRVAFQYLVLNRACYSGIITAGPIGGMSQSSSYKIDCRYNPARLSEAIVAASSLSSQITTICGSGLVNAFDERFSNDEEIFYYVDPPYYNQGSRLYRHSFAESDHVNLAENLKGLERPWLLSYDDVPFIRNLYQSISCRRVYFDYSVRTSKRAQELVISNCVLPPIYMDSGKCCYSSRVDRGVHPTLELEKAS